MARGAVLMVGGLLALVAGSPASAQESEVGRMFMRLAPEVQMEGLQLAVRDTENRCDRPLRHFYAGPGTQGRQWWDLMCDRGVAFRIRLPGSVDDVINVMRCDVMERNAPYRCFEPVPPPARAARPRQRS